MVRPDGKGRRVDARAPDAPAGSSTLRAAFVREGARTAVERLYEAGALRLRLPRGPVCEALLVNTGGGIVGGDRLAVDIAVGAGAALTLTSVAAEKIYRSSGPFATIDTRLVLGPGATLDWLPQETILFDEAKVERRFEIDMAPEARLLCAEMLVFGRLAKGETAIRGALRDSWRIRRNDRLLFADESRIEGAIGATLDRPAVAAGARATTLLLLVGPDAAERIDPLRAALEPFLDDVEGGASLLEGLLVARLVSRSPERLRAATMATLTILRDSPLPRSWI